MSEKAAPPAPLDAPPPYNASTAGPASAPATFTSFTVYSTTTTSNPYPPTADPFPPTAGAPLQPVPLSNFRTPEPAVVPEGICRSPDGKKLSLHTDPGCIGAVFMLPFPFLCMGCCLFETADTVFDSAAKEVSFANYPGFLMCLKKDRTVPYADVANVALSKTNMRINHQSTYATVLVLRNGEQLAVGGAALMDEAYARAAAVHQFLFAAGNPGYRVPQSYEMVL